MPGYLPTLLQIVANGAIPVALQHAAVLRLKNLVHQHWRFADDQDTTVSEADREVLSFNCSHFIYSLYFFHNVFVYKKNILGYCQVIRRNIYETIVHQQTSAIRSQLCECVNFICVKDFPERWPSLLPEVAAGFSAGIYAILKFSMVLLRSVIC